MKYVFDMETQDPDDFLTLLLLLGHPEVELAAVTVTPGTPEQVGLVRAALGWFGAKIPVGAWNIDHPKQCVSPWHARAYGAITPSRDAEPGGALLVRVCDEDTTLVTGGPLKNLGAAIALGGLTLGRWVAQGGFAGEGVVPRHRQLPKFAGRRTCPTFNLNGDPKSALAALAYPGIGARRFVSKNVCHGVIYDRAMHDAIRPLTGRARYLELIWHGMDVYLAKKRTGKALHDPLAACCAIDEGIGEWAEVELFRERGEWGARPAPGSGTFIITGYDHDRFLSTLTAEGVADEGRGR
jgi:pyrimidine-specific ribonucleoside hydrolase